MAKKKTIYFKLPVKIVHGDYGEPDIYDADDNLLIDKLVMEADAEFIRDAINSFKS